MTRISFGCVAVATVTAAGCCSAAGQSFSQFVGFGDSTVDSGWYRNAAPNSTNPVYNADFAIAVTQGGGKATTNPGLVSSEFLANYFNLTAAPANQPGGTNYATGDARNAQSNIGVPNSLQGAVPTVTQIGNYLAAHNGIANPTGLYLIGSGGNDISFALANLPAADRTSYVIGAANDLVGGIVQLQVAGARFIVVPDQPQSFGAANVQALRSTYDDALWGGLAAAHVNFIPADVNSVFKAVAANPSTFGFIPGAGPACTQPAGIPSGWAIFCAPTSTISTLVSPDAAQTHFFADDVHLTTAGQKIIADYEYSLIVAPSEISLLAELPVKTRATMVEAMYAEIALSQEQRKVGSFNAWISGGAAALRVDSSAPGLPGDSGTPLGVTVGLDYAVAPGWLVGGAFSAGYASQAFSLGGNFSQDEYALSAYAAFRGRSTWANFIGSAGVLDDKVNRVVPISITMQSNTGSTSGSNFSFAAEGGYDFRSGIVTHGPLAGVLLQHVDIDGYTETDSFAAIGGLTALSFAGQTRNSAVTELGYQARVELGAWTPFAKLAWNHELVSPNRLVTATLTTIGAPSYSMPALELGTDWATLSAGTSMRIGRNITGYAMVLGELGQDKETSYGGQAGINVALDWQ